MRELEEIKITEPREIERASFEIITRELGDRLLDPEQELVIKRVIHTTADFEYVDTLDFSEHVVPRAVEAIRQGAHIVTDTTMAMAGINKRVLKHFGGAVHNYIADEDVAERARELHLTRSTVAMDKAARQQEPFIYAIGNAPTALVRIYELVKTSQMVPPTLVIGVPVGFVNVVESKELICSLDVPHIVAKGRKGGSNVAAAIVNALLYLASNDQRE
ncbi:MAG: precorrin-8X methylmutase [Atopobiaceae bacterium]|jgi:precorrin-8X/cobalt-precorrin-8 methylmutase